MLVKNVTIKGIEWPLVLGMHLTEMVQKHASQENFTGVKMQAILIYYGHDNYCLVEGVENKLTLKECFAHVEEIAAGDNQELSKEMADLITAYMESKPVRDLIEAAASVEKKIAVGQKSDPTLSVALG